MSHEAGSILSTVLRRLWDLRDFLSFWDESSPRRLGASASDRSKDTQLLGKGNVFTLILRK